MKLMHFSLFVQPLRGSKFSKAQYAYNTLRPTVYLTDTCRFAVGDTVL
jgi:hypothetical protein